MSLITEIYDVNSARPVIVDFQNAKFKPGEEHNLKSGLYKNKRNETIIGIESNKMTYTGIINSTNLYNDYIVINNTRTNTCRLLPIDFATLQPQLEKKQDMLNVSASFHENSIADLNKQFGSKKTIRQTEQYERLKMNIDAVKEDLENTVAAIEVDTTDFGTTSYEENDGVYRPKINRDASKREQVYTLEDLIPAKVLKSLDKEVEYVIKNLDSIEDLKFRPFVAYYLERLKEMNVPEEVKHEHIRILTYMHYLIHFFSIPLKSMSKKFSVCDNKDVNFHILDNFSTPSTHGRLRPISMRTKAICYLLVLTLFVADYEVNIEELAKDFKIGIKKVQEIGRVLALSQGKDKSLMTLKLPLPAVVSVSAKRKRK